MPNEKHKKLFLDFIRKALPGLIVYSCRYVESSDIFVFLVKKDESHDAYHGDATLLMHESLPVSQFKNKCFVKHMLKSLRACYPKLSEVNEDVICEEFMESVSREYPLSIDVNVLKHLGINLYSNVPAVLTELVANAWDADAEEVVITIDVDNDIIEIFDSGPLTGMSHGDITGKFLRVGYERRPTTGDLTRGGRPVMGRKGVGKLAPFSIANVVEVYSTSDGEKSGLRMDAEDIAASNGNYMAEPMPTDECLNENGTKIILRQLKKERIRVDYLTQRLARRFSVIGTEEFKVFISSKDQQHEVTARDRGDLQKLQYLWIIGDWTPPSWVDIPSGRITYLDDFLEGWGANQKVKGWIGTANKPSDLGGAAGNLNVITILSRGRLFDENALWQINDSRTYLNYVAGHLQADFLDNTDAPDIATSDRQRIQEDDQRYQDVLAFIRSSLSKIEKVWSEWRIIDGKKEIADQHPEVSSWLAMMGESHRKHAEKMLGGIMKYHGNAQEKETLLESAILGFERVRLSGGTQELADSVEKDPARLLSVLADRDSFEASLYRNIIKNRIDIIRTLESKIKDNDLENSVRDYIFEHLWLIDPSWERANGSSYMEKNVAAEFQGLEAELTDEERRGRMDIKYRHTSGLHLIIELKRPDRKMSIYNLVPQGHKYRSALQKYLSLAGRGNEPIETVFVLGVPPTEASEPNYEQIYNGQMASISGRIVYFRNLVDSALQSYSEYLDKSKDFDRVEQLVAAVRKKGVK